MERMRSMAKRLYVAYGSNLNVEQMRWRCPGARIIGTGELRDWRLLYKGSRTGSYLTLEPCPGRMVPVAVWEVTEEDERSLDRYEGFPHFYGKTELELPIRGIRSGRVKNRRCFVYLMQDGRRCGIPSKAYIQTCREGYESFGFDPSILSAALKDTLEEMGCVP